MTERESYKSSSKGNRNKKGNYRLNTKKNNTGLELIADSKY